MTEEEAPVSFALTPLTTEETPEVYRIESDNLLDYDAESGIVYGKKRTKVYYGKYYLEADEIILNDRTKEVQARGSVILRSPLDEVEADYIRYNFDQNRGYAEGMYGRHNYLFFKSPKDEEEPAFLRLSEDEALLRDASFTNCDFSTPHYRVRAKEFLIYTNERIFARSAVLYVWEFPVFYFPVYSRSLREHSPWSFFLGYSSRLGYYLRIGYDYWHRLDEPMVGDESKTIRRSTGHLAAHLDYFSDRGIGYGLTYKYRFHYDKHRGELLLYNIDDEGRILEGEEQDEDRWVARIMHRSEILNDLVLLLDIDQLSDPEVYWDFVDRFALIERGRLPERRSRVALTLRRDDFIARILVEAKDRLSRNRITNFSNPGDNDLDFDEDPLNLWEDSDDNEGLRRKRYGRVSERLPQVTFTTNKLKILDFPLYYNADLNIINNLDRGLNLIDDGDDAFVRGGDLYQTLTHILRFSPRYTLLTKLGAGISYFSRESDDYNYKFPPGTVFPATIDNTTFADENSFILGTRRVSLKDIDPFAAYGDAEVRFNARFTDYVSAFLRYKIRESTDDSMGEYYESLGDQLAKEDIYNFRTKEHFIEGRINYASSFPKINLWLNAWQNLQSESDIYANEKLTHIGIGGDYKNQPETFTWSASMNYEKRQILDPTDPAEYEEDIIYGYSGLMFIPPHHRYWASLGTSVYHILGEEDSFRTEGEYWWDSEFDRRDEESSFSEEDTEVTVDARVGGQIGPKYVLETGMQYHSRYDGIRGFEIILKRDLHDFIAQVMFSMERDLFSYDDEGRRGEDWEWDIRFALELKTPFLGDQRTIGPSGISTLVDTQKNLLLEEQL